MKRTLLSRVIARIEYIGRRLHNVYVFRRSTFRYRQQGGKRAVLSLASDRFHRYAYCLAKWLEQEGYAVRVEVAPSVVRSLDRYTRLPAVEGLVSRIRRGIIRDAVVLEANGIRREVELSPDYFGAEDMARLPMSMHPFMYHKGLTDEVKRLRDTPRSIRVLYAGSRGGSTDLVSEAFGLVKREDVLAYLFEQSPHAIRPLARYPGLEEVKRFGPLVFAVRDVANVPQGDVLALMAASDFYLALPGWTIPHAHNLTECMAVGAIPITQYGAYLHPPLEHGRTCLAFHDLQSLDEVISEALRMSEQEIAEMRRQVIRYYEEHLSSRAAVRLLETTGAGRVALMAEQGSVPAIPNGWKPVPAPALHKAMQAPSTSG